jgi:16S rRNA (cytosine967-C5)-methyltransferase
VPDLCQRLAATGLAAEPHPFCPEQYIVLPRGVAIPDVPGYQEGHFFVQDPSCSEAIRLLDPRPGERILDACAAPGGKLMLAADRMRGEGQLVAADRHADRMGPLRENLARMGWKNIRTAQADARSYKDLHAALDHQPADAVLLDVPCTNTGVLRRRPDARWRFTEERLTTQTATQKEILNAAAHCLKPGGRIVYSTCSLEPEEDEGLVAAWSASAPEFRLADEVKRVPPADGIDGAYAALLVRSSA